VPRDFFFPAESRILTKVPWTVHTANDHLLCQKLQSKSSKNNQRKPKIFGRIIKNSICKNTSKGRLFSRPAYISNRLNKIAVDISLFNVSAFL